MICSRSGRTTIIRTKSWQVSRISTGSKAKNRRPCLYCERNKHGRLAARYKKSPSRAQLGEKEGGLKVIFPASDLARLPKPDHYQSIVV
nr:MAG TPA: hypothetical protein [Caudoviricetes sp.]